MIVSGLILGAIVALLPHAIWLVWWLVSETGVVARPAYAPFGWTAVGLVVLLWAILAYGYWVGRFQVRTVQTTYSSPTLPEAFDGYKIVQISDLHLSTFDDRPAALQRIVDSINALEPDLICFTGDLVTIGTAEAAPYTDILRSLRAKDGVVSVLGNHDMLIYTPLTEEQRLMEVEQLATYERDSLGWTLLRNAHQIIERNGQTLTIVGVDNSSCGSEGFKTIYMGDIPHALAGTDGFRILLSHDPTHWRAEVLPRTNIELTLSGHTHSGQIRLFGVPLSRISFPESAGWYAEGQQSLYVNSGIGCTLPIRLNCPGEITIIELHRPKQLTPKQVKTKSGQQRKLLTRFSSMLSQSFTVLLSRWRIGVSPTARAIVH